MANLREQDLWSDQIYLIERHDPLMGGEYGINNIQARQLGCRTVWLLARLMAEHTPDGGHALDNEHIAENAGILERKLNLDFSTEPMGKELERISLVLEEQHNSLAELVNLESSLYGPLYEALKISWKFGYPGFAFELFNPVFSLRPALLPVRVMETISGDDSIDVSSSETLEVGATYILWDEDDNQSEFVTVKNILTDKRVILCHSETTTRLGKGVLTAASWLPGKRGFMLAPGGSKYISRRMDILNNLAGGRLVIAHTGETGFVVEIRRTGEASSSIWERLPLIAREYREQSRVWKSEWQIPGCSFYFRITVQDDCEIDHIAIVSDHANSSVSQVRTPRVVDGDFTLDRYGALYGVPHASTIFEISPDADFRAGCICLEFGPEKSRLPIWDYRLRVLSEIEPLSSGDALWWRARYKAENGDVSGFSSLGRYIQP